MKESRIVLYIVLGVGALSLLATKIIMAPPDPNAPARAIAMMPATDMRESWHEVFRVKLPVDMLEVDSWKGWYARGGDPNPKIRSILSGSFAASEPDVTLALLDSENYERLKAGYPPMVFYSAASGQPVRAQTPVDGYFYGFFRKPAEGPREIPTSLGELMLTLLRSYQVSHRPPARLSVDLSVSIEQFCTDREALATRMKMQHTQAAN